MDDDDDNLFESEEFQLHRHQHQRHGANSNYYYCDDDDLAALALSTQLPLSRCFYYYIKPGSRRKMISSLKYYSPLPPPTSTLPSMNFRFSRHCRFNNAAQALSIITFFISLFFAVVVSGQSQEEFLSTPPTPFAAALSSPLQARRVPITELETGKSFDAVAASVRRQQRSLFSNAAGVTPATFPDRDEETAVSTNATLKNKPKLSHLGRASEVNIKCSTNNAMQITVRTRMPFEGLLFVGQSHARSPKCRIDGHSGLRQYDLTISLRQCGVILKKKTDTSATYAVHVYVQYHPVIQQSTDDELYAECEIATQPQLHDERSAQHDKKRLEYFANYTYPQLVGQPPPPREMPMHHAWMEIFRDTAADENLDEQSQKYDNKFLRAQLVNGEVTLGERLIVAVRTPKPDYDASGNVLSEADVVMCRVHDSSESNYETLIDRYGCPVDSSIMPAFKTHSEPNSNELIRYSIIQAFKFPDNNHLHFTCKVIYCTNGPCPRVNCANVDQVRLNAHRASTEMPTNLYYREIAENERRVEAAAHLAAFRAFIPIPQDDIMGGGTAITLTPGETNFKPISHNAYHHGRYKREVDAEQSMRAHLKQALRSALHPDIDGMLLVRHKRQVRNNYYYEDLPYYSSAAGGSGGGGAAGASNDGNIIGQRDVVNSVRVYNNANDTSQAAAQYRERRVEDDGDNNSTVAQKEKIPHGRLFCLRSDLFWAMLGLILGFLVLCLLISLLCCCMRRRRRSQKRLYRERERQAATPSPYYYYSESGLPPSVGGGGYQPYASTASTTRMVPPSAGVGAQPYTPYAPGSIPQARLVRR